MGIGYNGVGGRAADDGKMPPKSADHHVDVDGGGAVCVRSMFSNLASTFDRTSSRNPEKTTIPPPPSGPKPYENALDESGLSTTISEYGGPGIPCGEREGVREQLASANLRMYSDARGRGRRGNSAGGGKGMSSGPHSNHPGPSSRSRCRRGIALSSRRSVS